MRTVALAVAALAFVLPTAAPAQPGTPTITPPPAVPGGQSVSSPIPASAATDPASLPGGTDVSQPLQPVVIADPTQPPTVTQTEIVIDDRDPRPGQVLGHSWGSDELLLWWPKAHPVPPLVTATRLGAPPVLGRPETVLLVGNRSIDTQDVAGYRLTMGWSLNKADTVGIEGQYFFLGTRTLSTSVTDIGNIHYRAIGLPYINALTGAEDVLTVAQPGLTSALVRVSTTTRVQGAEANTVANLFAGKGAKLHAIAGYRFFQVNEGLRVENSWLQYGLPGSPQTVGAIADQFDGRNEFHGGQVGLMADLHRGPFYVEITGKVALGRNFQVVFVDGETHLLGAANPFPIGGSFPGGVYAQPSNIGRFTHSAFAVVPEGIFKVGFKVGDRGRFYVGYNFLYMSDVVRPGDQIDRTVNPAQVPLLGGSPLFTGQDRPRVTFDRTDFWVQGLIIGFEGRF